MPKHLDLTIDLYLRETFYRNSLEWEDGHGSLQNVVSRSTYDRWQVATMRLSEAETLTRKVLKSKYGEQFRDDSPDGFEEYSYMLEYPDPETGEWQYINHVR